MEWWRGDGDDDSVTEGEQAMRHTRKPPEEQVLPAVQRLLRDGKPDGFKVPEDVFSDLSAKSMEKIWVQGGVPRSIHQKKRGVGAGAEESLV